METFKTIFGSLEKWEKGQLEIINDNPRNYAYSNIFDVASRSKPYEKVAVAKNLEYVIEAIRAEGTSDWYAASHDEFVIVMDGEVEVSIVELASPEAVAPPGKPGTVRLGVAPQGNKMGTVRLRRGHQALLPKGAAYQFKAASPSVMLQQTIVGDLTVERWGEICLH